MALLVEDYEFAIEEETEDVGRNLLGPEDGELIGRDGEELTVVDVGEVDDPADFALDDVMTLEVGGDAVGSGDGDGLGLREELLRSEGVALLADHIGGIGGLDVLIELGEVGRHLGPALGCRFFDVGDAIMELVGDGLTLLLGGEDALKEV